MKSAQELFDEGYRVVSRKYHLAVRLPPGKTALEALIEAVPAHRAKWARLLDSQGEAANHYRRVYAPDDLKIVVSRGIRDRLIALAHAEGEPR